MFQPAAPEATVVIPARNAASTLPACLQALRAQVEPHPAFEVVVVDDGSTDATAAVAREMGAIVVSQPHVGAGAARNRGVSAARGPIILFTDADCAPEPDWVSQLCGALALPSLAGARGVYRSDQCGLVARFVQLEYEDKYRPLAPGQSIDFVDTYSAAYRRQALIDAGGFDPAIHYVEDQELSYRATEMGFSLVFAPSACVAHRHAATLGAFARKKYFIAHWKVAVMVRHPSKLASDTHTPASQRVQHALGLLAFPLVPLAVAFVWARLGLAALALAFLATALPFSVRAAVRDRQVAMATPALLAVRAAAQALGWVTGLVRFWPARSRWRRFLPQL